jgi:lipoyl-dependent peroxiredoxin
MLSARRFLMNRRGSAVWRGGLKGGAGNVSTESGAVKEVSYNFSKRFENEPGTNPEELIAAAHAACFSMALSAQLGEAGLEPEEIRTTATTTIEKTDAGMTVTKIRLETWARVPNASREQFEQAANNAKAGCPISRLLNADITLDARLES